MTHNYKQNFIILLLKRKNKPKLLYDWFELILFPHKKNDWAEIVADYLVTENQGNKVWSEPI